MRDQKIDAPPRTLVRGLIGARFLDDFNFSEVVVPATSTCCSDRRADHTLKSVVSSKTKVFECARKSLIFDIGRHDRHKIVEILEGIICG